MPVGMWGDAHRRIGLVDVLAACTRCAESVDAHFRRIQHHVVDLVDFRHYGDGARRCMDASLRFGDRHTLHAVPARLEFEPRIDALADDAGDDFLVTTEVRFVGRDDFDLPALALGVARIHAEEITGKQRRLVAAGAGPDFEHDVLVVVGIFRQQEFLQVEFDLRQPRLGGFDFFFGQFGHLPHRRIGQHLLPGSQIGLGTGELVEERDHRRQLGVFAVQATILIHVARRVLARQQGIEFDQTAGELVELFSDAGFHGQ